MHSQPKPKLAILGAGSFATALIKIFSDNDSVEIFWWIRRPEMVKEIQNLQHNPRYLPTIPINLPSHHLSSNLKQIIDQVDWVLIAIPAAFIHQELKVLEKGSLRDKKIISVVKGMVPDMDLVIADYVQQYHEVSLDNFVVLTGPCHAEEIVQEKLSYLTAASQNQLSAEQVANFVKNQYIHTQTSADIYGTEYASVLKNIISLASGIFHGLGYGDNFQAVFIANAIQEIKYFMDQLYPLSREINDSPYLGDLLVTAYSQFSRNRTFGMMIGKGYSVKSAQLEMNMIAEGYFASASIHHIVQRNKLKMPITETVFRILYEQADPLKEMEKLTHILH